MSRLSRLDPSPNGPVVETPFRSDDFNVYPPRNRTRYPDSGDVFTVRYLPRHSDELVIVRNDSNRWSNRLRCEELPATAGQADQKTTFAPENLALRQAAQAMHAAVQLAGGQSDNDSN